MKFALSWLKLHLETDASVETIAERLTALGLEVEQVVDRTAVLAPFTVASVVSAEPHPDADKLRVCVVDTGSQTLQVVCGAPNARAGMKGVFAPSGTVIPGTGDKLKKSKIRGVESNGMLCSEREMGLSDDHDSIIELPDDARLGVPFAGVIGLDDPVIEIQITPNRADCLGVRGIARDLAAGGLGSLKDLDSAPVPATFESPVAIKLEFAPDHADACPLFVARLVRGVTSGPSPTWLQERLLSVGLRPISALVDITNYLTIGLGRPAHIFDAGRIKGDLWVRTGCGGQTIRALDGKDYTLDDEMTGIGDDTGLLSIAGVMGGEATGCTESTTDVLLEIALFDPARTARTGRTLGIESDARYRFERGVDPAFAIPGAEIGTRLILELCGGEASQLLVAGEVPEWRRQIAFDTSQVARIGGVEMEEIEAGRILQALGYRLDEMGSRELVVEPPSWRGDVAGPADLVEDVLRIHGYDKIPAISLRRPSGTPVAAIDLALQRVNRVKHALAARGLSETVTWSFTSDSDAALFGGVPDCLRLANPISADLDVMRPSILPNLIRGVAQNVARGRENVGLFEVGPQFAGDAPEDESRVAAGLRRGWSGPRHWAGERRALDAFDAKADALAALQASGVTVDGLQSRAEAPGWYHPGRSGVLALGPNVMANFGELHPMVLSALDLDGPVVGFELMLDAVPKPKAKKSGRARPALRASDLPAVERDFAFVVDEAVTAGAVLRAAKGAEKALIGEVRLFDVYRGEGVAKGKKSLAVAVRLQPTDHTFTDTEIEAIGGKIVAAVAKATGASLRG